MARHRARQSRPLRFALLRVAVLGLAGRLGAAQTCSDADGNGTTDDAVDCGAGATCNDVAAPGTGYTCTCGTGYDGDTADTVCVDFDGCQDANADGTSGDAVDCGAGATCNDVAAPGTGYTCTCGTGYDGDTADTVCVDFDGCQDANADGTSGDAVDCGAGATCNDVAAPGTGYTCTCGTGYDGDTADTVCVDFDGCQDANADGTSGDAVDCGAGATCNDVAAPGTGYTCTCGTGYDGDTADTVCVDFDGCQDANADGTSGDAVDCGAGATCNDVAAPGTGYTCTCGTGYDGDTADTVCVDFDGCQDANADGTSGDAVDCGAGATCNDVAAPGTGYTCTCGTGYDGDTADTVCVDFDGCQDANADGTSGDAVDCGAGATCNDVAAPGTGYTCTCGTGYDGDTADTVCVDFDGCQDANADGTSGDAVDCGAVATCNDVAAPGTGYTCICGTGYWGSVVTDEAASCTEQTCDIVNAAGAGADCGTGATCSEGGTGDGYTCTCNSGYAGSDVSNGAASCVICPAGQYQADIEVHVCEACPAGQTSAVAGMFLTCLACDAGSYSSADRLTCEECPIGQVDEDSDPASDCTVCAAGTVSTTAALTSCTICEAGKYSNEGAISEGVDECVACPAGQYDDDDSSATVCALCPDETPASDPGASAAAGGCSVCEAGWYQDPGPEGACTRCPAGQYDDDGDTATACEACEEGQISATAGTVAQCTECPSGTYADAATACIECVAGQYDHDEAAETECENCIDGKYSGTGDTVCSSCESGKYAGAAASSCIPCAAGTYDHDDNANTECRYCEAGYADVDRIPTTACTECSAGTFAIVGQSACEVCSAGKYAAAGSGSCDACTGAESDHDYNSGTPCQPCEAGTVPTTVGDSAVGCDSCSTGQYAAAGALDCTDCAPGQYDHDDDPATECTSCPTGLSSDAGANSGGCAECGSGWYETGGLCTRCVAGQYDGDGDKATACTNCAAGQMSAEAGATSCSACETGQYSAAGASACIECPAGRSSADVEATSCIECDAGQYSAEGADVCSNCAAGKYTAAGAVGSTSEDACIDCEAGKYAAANAAGSSSQDACIDCPAGKYVDTPGNVNSDDDSDACIECPAGKYAAAGVEGNDESTDCNDCAAGKSFLGSASHDENDCEPCEAGKADTDSNPANECDECDVGQFAAGGGIECADCIAGTYDNDLDPTSECTNCPGGQHTANLATAFRCFACETGKFTSDGEEFRSTGAAACTDCPAGTHDEDSNPSTVCINCVAGKQSAVGMTACDTCGVGQYAPEASAVCSDCVVGKYDSDYDATAGIDSINIVEGTITLSQTAISVVEARQSVRLAHAAEASCSAEPINAELYVTEISENSAGQAVLHVSTITVGDDTADANCLVALNSAATACDSCNAGETSVLKATECTTCPEGTYSAEADVAGCTDCVEGKFDDDAPRVIILLDSDANSIDVASATDHLAANRAGIQLVDAPNHTCIAGPQGEDLVVSGVSGVQVTFSTDLEPGDASAGTNCLLAVVPNSAATVCVNCPSGKTAEAGATSCHEYECAAFDSDADPGYVPVDPTATTATGLGAISCATPNFIQIDTDTAPTAVCSGTNAKFTFSGCRLSSCAPGSEMNDDSDDCSPCAAGKADLDSQPTTPCTPCVAGAYSNTNTSCEVCPAGYWSNAGSAACGECAAGQSDDDYNPSTACEDCEPGTVTENRGSKGPCSLCSAGQYAASGQSICSECAPGQYDHDDDPATECTSCPTGLSSDAGANSGGCAECGSGWYETGGLCTRCVAGQYDGDGDKATACTNCAAGQMSAEAGATSCSACETGQYSAAGASACIECPAGRSSADPGTECQPCDAGKHQASAAQTSCTACDSGQYAPTAATSCIDCTEGTFDDDSQASTPCENCEAGQYTGVSGAFATCDSCTPGQYAAEASAACANCEAGTVDEDGNAATACTTCDNGKYLSEFTPLTIAEVPDVSYTLTINGATDIVAGQKFRITTAAGAQGDCTVSPTDGTEIQVQSVAGGGTTTTLTLTQELTGIDTAQHCMLSATECTSCELGAADTDADPSTPCVECSRGQYAPGGGTDCSDCPAGQYDHDTDSDATEPVISLLEASNEIVIAGREAFYYEQGDKLQLAHAVGKTCSAAPLPPVSDLVIDAVVSSCVPSDEQTTCADEPVAGSCETTAGSGTCSYQTKISFETDLTTTGETFESDGCALVLPTQGRSPCIDCEVGRYSSYTGTVYSCFACTAGTQTSSATGDFVVSGATQCLHCESGKYDHDSYGGTECIDCDGGTASAAGQVECTTCNAGQFSTSGAATCDDCAAGKHDSDSNATTMCVECVAGTYSMAGETTCTACAPGKFADVAASFCAVCVVDTYDHDDDPATECESCPDGTNSDGNTGLTNNTGCVENVCVPFSNQNALQLLGYEASETAIATQPHGFGTLSCYDATHSRSRSDVEPSAICTVAGEVMVLSGCELRCTPFASEDEVHQLGYTADSPTAVTVGALGEIGCYTDTHVLTDETVLPSATCAGLPDAMVPSGCSPRAECSTMAEEGHECPDGYHLNNDTLTSLCVSYTCDSTIDRDTCCSLNTCEAQEPDTGYTASSTAGSTSGVTTVPELEPIGCAAGYMGTPSDSTFVDNTPATPTVACLKETNSNAGIGAFTFSGCEPSVCKVLDEVALSQQGYTISNQETLTDYATVAELGDVECAIGYTNSSSSDLAPTVTCEWDGVVPVADFVFTGCEQHVCAAPDVGQLVDVEGDETKARSRYIITQSGTQASDLVIECAPEFVGTPSAVCESSNAGFTYSGCVWRTCAAPGDKTGYNLNAAGTTGDLFVRNVNFNCSYQGYPTFEGCTEDDGEFVFSGCAATPDKTSRAVGAAGVGDRWVVVSVLLVGVHLPFLYR